MVNFRPLLFIGLTAGSDPLQALVVSKIGSVGLDGVLLETRFGFLIA